MYAFGKKFVIGDGDKSGVKMTRTRMIGANSTRTRLSGANSSRTRGVRNFTLFCA